MSMMHAMSAAFPAAASDVITLSGETVNAFSFGSDARAEVRLLNALMYRRVNTGSYIQIDVSTDWIRPEGSAGAPYRTRYTNRTGDPLNAATSQSEDTWQTTASAYFWVQIDSSPFAGGEDSTFDIQVDDGSVVQATGSYRLIADREDF